MKLMPLVASVAIAAGAVTVESKTVLGLYGDFP
jgi:hypothetical protein